MSCINRGQEVCSGPAWECSQRRPALCLERLEVRAYICWNGDEMLMVPIIITALLGCVQWTRRKVSLSQHIPLRSEVLNAVCAVGGRGRLGLGGAKSERGCDSVQCEKLAESWRCPELAQGSLVTNNLLDKGHGWALTLRWQSLFHWSPFLFQTPCLFSFCLIFQFPTELQDEGQ